MDLIVISVWTGCSAAFLRNKNRINWVVICTWISGSAAWRTYFLSNHREVLDISHVSYFYVQRLICSIASFCLTRLALYSWSVNDCFKFGGKVVMGAAAVCKKSTCDSDSIKTHSSWSFHPSCQYMMVLFDADITPLEAGYESSINDGLLETKRATRYQLHPC
jgi:hypothetical protein